MDNINKGRVIILEELFIKSKTLFTILALFIVHYVVGDEFPNVKELDKLLTLALIVYILEGIIFVYKTQFKTKNHDNLKPSFVSLIIDLSIISLFVFFTIETKLSLYPLFLVFVLIQTLRFPQFHSAVFASVATVVYLSIVIITRTPDSIVTGEVLMNIAFFYLFAFIIAGVIREINSLVNQVSLAQSQLKDKNARLKEMSQKDLMTDMLNHKSFYEIFYSLRKRYPETKENFCLAILDIDNFKHINDNYGHLAGDQVLVEVAKIIKEEIRNQDIVARYGGEEFTIIFTNTELADGLKVCERIRRKVSEKEFRFNNNSIFITLSGGVCSNNSYVAHDDSYFIQSVDNMLYEAKKTGKNKIVHKMEVFRNGAIIKH